MEPAIVIVRAVGAMVPGLVFSRNNRAEADVQRDMRRLIVSGTLALGFLGGCAGAAESEVRELDLEAEVPHSGEHRFAIVPDGKREPTGSDEPAGPDAPRLILVEQDDPRCDSGECLGLLYCSFDLLSRNLPAVSADGSVVVHLAYSPIPYHSVDLVWRSLDDPSRFRTERVYDEPADDESCERDRADLSRRLDEINGAFERTSWTALPLLKVETLPGPDTAADPPVRPDPRAPAERPVQVRLRNGTYVVRVPGVEVLHRIPWDHGPNIDIGRVWADERTGVSLLEYFDTNGVCSAAPPERVDARVAHLPREVFEEARRRTEFVGAW